MDNRLHTVPDPVGIEAARNEVIKLLDLEDSSGRVVIIDGESGIGKTTLATAVVNSLNLSDYQYYRVEIDSDLDDPQDMQHNLFLKDFKLDNCMQGRKKLFEALAEVSKPFFFFIDNAPRIGYLRWLLPIEEISLIPGSRILATSNQLHEDFIRWPYNFQISIHRVGPLSDQEAKRLLCHYASRDGDRSFDADDDLDSLVQICGGIPLYLTLVGSQLSRSVNAVSAWIENKKQTEERKIWNVEKCILEFVCRQLRAPCQEAFFYLVYGWELSKVVDIVGEGKRILEDLERAALVSTSEEGELKIHDIVRAQGRELAKEKMAVGIEEAENEVIELLDLKDSSPRAVVIHGVGGIGKTTLATAVFNRLDLRGYNHCRVDIHQDSRDSDLKDMQEQILRHLFDEELKLDNCGQGRVKLSEAFGKASTPVFLFIDNLQIRTQLLMLLPAEHLSGLPMLSRIIITTRNLEQSDIFGPLNGIEVYSHTVGCLAEAEAKRLLCRYAFRNRGFDPDDFNLKSLVQICGGIPLCLTLVGSEQNWCKDTMSTFNEILNEMRDLKELEGGEGVADCMVAFMYRQLSEASKKAFLYIAFNCYDWKRGEVSDIVGELVLEDLEGAALVNTSEEGKVKMHDIIRARGRQLWDGNIIPVFTYGYREGYFAEPEPKRFLYRYLRNDPDDFNLDGLLKICGGIPLYLTLVASHLNRSVNIVSACNEILNEMEDLKELEGGEHLRERIIDFVCRQLSELSKKAFMYIAFSCYNWNRGEVSANFGDLVLEELQGAALVATSAEGKVNMHHIVRARASAIELLEGHRILVLPCRGVGIKVEENDLIRQLNLKDASRLVVVIYGVCSEGTALGSLSQCFCFLTTPTKE